MFVCRPEGSGGQAGEDRRHGAAGGHLRGQEEGHAGGTRPMEESHGREVSFPYKNSVDVMGSGQELTFRRSCFNLNTVFNKYFLVVGTGDPLPVIHEAVLGY